MDIEDDFEFGLTKPVNDFIDIEDVEKEMTKRRQNYRMKLNEQVLFAISQSFFL